MVTVYEVDLLKALELPEGLEAAYKKHWPDGGASVGDIANWLMATAWDDDILAPLVAELESLWRAAYEAGRQAAIDLTGYSGPVDDQQLDDLISGLSNMWVDEILETLAERVAYGFSEDKPFEPDQPYATRIAETEVTRAMSYGAAEIYRKNNNDDLFDWEIGSDNPCEDCIANAAGAPRRLGDPWPSGATMPPQHVHCGCALVPHKE